MRRRHLLVATVGALAIGGCGDVLGEDEPAEAVEAYVDALDDGDADAANEMLHPDGEMEPVTDVDLAALEEFDLRVEGAETIEEDDDRAVVEFELALSHPEFGDVPSVGEMELRTDEGEWRIWAERGAGLGADEDVDIEDDEDETGGTRGDDAPDDGDDGSS